jgi:N-terminal acetyltransferase B complex non-catalytic subunit
MSQSSACSIESELAFAKKCCTHYHSGLLLGKDLVSTELQPADDLAVLAVTALINAHHLASQDSSISPSDKHFYLYDSIVLLEFASTKSRWAYAARFLLVRLYRLLGASSLALQNYTMANVKSVQCDTLSHHVLSRASTFSLGCAGDLSLINECVESSQVYSVNGVDVSQLDIHCPFHLLTPYQTSDQLVKAFQYERYTQVADFVMLEEKVDNSLQRDITKLEHFRMKNMHEGLTPETVEVELVELRFVWGRSESVV